MVTQNSILDAAQSLFAQFGLKKVTTDDIARKAHVSKATIYKFYKNKSEIFDVVVRLEAERLIREMEDWSWGSLLEKRAAAAALCEPCLLGDERQAEKVLQILDEITSSLGDVEERKSENIKALRKGLGYCWSVAVVANPGAGKPLMEKWMGSNDKDIVWIMKENLKKKRLARMDAEWVVDCNQLIF